MFLKNSLLIILIVFVSLFCFNNFCQAQSISGDVSTFGKTVYGEDSEPDDLRVTAARIINTGLTLLGILFIVLMLYGGYLYLTSLGKEEQIKKAKQLIVSAVIGVVIVLAAYAISAFVLSAIQKSAMPNYPGAGGDGDVVTEDE